MKIKCEFCGSFINDTDEICPNCSAANEHLVRAGSDIPKSLEELSRFCSEKKLPLEKMRFFIGNDCKEAKADIPIPIIARTFPAFGTAQTIRGAVRVSGTAQMIHGTAAGMTTTGISISQTGTSAIPTGIRTGKNKTCICSVIL